MATVKDFIAGARPKTLFAAISPVILGAAVGASGVGNFWEATGCSGKNVCYQSYALVERQFFLLRVDITIACLIVALALQVGVNYANDYSDGIRGTDKDRVGPMRLVGSGTASPKAVLNAMFASFGVAAVAGIYVASQSSWWLIFVGATCMALAWFYTGGKHPYGYYGLGEVVVFVCFGLVATAGTSFAVRGELTSTGIVAGIIPGLFAVLILLANNIRDINGDREAHKRTLASRIGEKRAKILFYVVCFAIFNAQMQLLLLLGRPELIFIMLLSVVALYFVCTKLAAVQSPRDYIKVLVLSSYANLAICVLYAVSLWAVVSLQEHHYVRWLWS